MQIAFTSDTIKKIIDWGVDIMKKNNMKLASVILIFILGVVLTSCGKKTENKIRLNDYAVRALNQAREASDSGTFGVGGILMDLKGNVICEMHNKVIDGNRTNDPTAHGERQIVDWYFANKEKNNLPEPENCVLITTLDPCVMCTGALVQAQFNRVIVVALDDYAGINWQCTAECAALAGTDCQMYVKEHFAYPEVTGSMSRKAFGAGLSDLNMFSDITISSETLNGCVEAFSLAVDDVRSKVASNTVELSDIKNPANLETSHPIRKYLAESLGDYFLACSLESSTPNDFINYVQKEHPNFQGVAYFDSFGNLLYLAEDDENISSQSAFMKVTRKIAEVRNTDPIEGYEINEYLSSPKYGYFVYMNCPKISAKTIMELGAIGSTFEDTSVHPIMYIDGEENIDPLNSVIKQLPPLYNELINIHFKQIF